MASRDRGYYDYDSKADVICRHCGWCGPADGHVEFFNELLEVHCPACGALVLVVPYPTAAETRAAASKGDPRAQTELLAVEYREERASRARRVQPERPEQLPDLPGSEWRIDWDYEQQDREHWTILKHGDTVLWREIAYFEGSWRLEQVFEILRRRYGRGLIEVRPTARSWMFLGGDDLQAPRVIERLNASLRAQG